MAQTNNRHLNVGDPGPAHDHRRVFRDPLLTALVERADGEVTGNVISSYSQLSRMRDSGVEITPALIDYMMAQITEAKVGAELAVGDGWDKLTRRIRPPDAAPSTSEKTSQVYFIRWGDRIKIGRSVDPTARARSISLPSSSVLMTVPGGVAEERRLHVKFKKLRIRYTEWFAASPELLIYIEDLRAGRAV